MSVVLCAGKHGTFLVNSSDYLHVLIAKEICECRLCYNKPDHVKTNRISYLIVFVAETEKTDRIKLHKKKKYLIHRALE